MIIIGHSDIEYEPFYKIKSKEDIKNTPSNSMICFEYDLFLCKYAKNNNLSFAVFVKDEKEVIFTANFTASYIICEKDLAKIAQKFADDYLFDSKILALIDSEDEIVEIAKEAIDGVVFKGKEVI
jgi:hypothetical protein